MLRTALLLATLGLVFPAHLSAEMAVPGSQPYADAAVHAEAGRSRSTDDGGKHSQLVERSTGLVPKVVSTVGGSDHVIPFFPSASNPTQQGFVRIVNVSDQRATVAITAVDDAGVEFGPVTVALPPNGAQHFNSDDLEQGNSNKLAGATGPPTRGDWRLLLDARAEVDALAYIRTVDGFLTSMNEVGQSWSSGRYHRVPTFNPASNRNQRSRLRLVNPSAYDVDVTIFAWDDEGSLRSTRGALTRGMSTTLTALQLERGPEGWSRGLGDGEGKWRLQVEATGPIHVVSLLEDPEGYLTNLSSATRFSSTTYTGGRIRLFKSALHPSQQGFLRIINYSDVQGEVSIRALDDDGVEFGPISLTLPARGARHFNSGDMENGNPNKLSGATGSPSAGDWRLSLETELNIVALSYVRTTSGFLTSLNEAISWGEGGWWYVPTFNPGSNQNQQSMLRLDNYGDTPVRVSIRGIDDDGRTSKTNVTGQIPAHSAVTLTAQELERGPSGWSGSLGDGQGKWRLLIPHTGFTVKSLLEDPRGYITDLSTSHISQTGIAAVVNGLVPAAEPSAGLLKSTVDTYTESMAEFTLDIFAVTADSKQHALRGADLEIRSFTGDSTQTEFNFQQLSVRQHTQPYLGPYSAFLMDQSGSITSTDPNDARIEAARVFLDNLSSGDEVALLAFASGGSLPYDPVTVYRDSGGNGFTVDAGGFDSALANLADAEGGGTPLYDAILRALNYTRQEANNANRAVLVFTDGEDTDSSASIDDAIDAAVSMGIPLHTVALSSGVDVGVLSRLAGETDGSLTRANNAGELISYYGALGPFLSGSSQFYRTKWRVNLSGGSMRFGPGASFWTGVLVALPSGVKWVPFRVDFQ